MIMKFLQKVPAGLMLVPLLIGAVIHTLFPQALEIGGLTTAAFSNAGAATCRCGHTYIVSAGIGNRWIDDCCIF